MFVNNLVVLSKSNINFYAGFGEALQKFIKNLMTPTWTTILAHLIASVLIIVCVIWWFWKPTNKFISKHKNVLCKTHRELTVSNREVQHYLKLLKTENELMKTVKIDTMNQIQEESLSILENSRIQAKEAAEIIIKNSEKRAQAIEEQANEFIKNNVVKLSVDLTKKLVGNNINEENSKKVIDSYLKELENKSISDEFKK